MLARSHVLTIGSCGLWRKVVVCDGMWMAAYMAVRGLILVHVNLTDAYRISHVQLTAGRTYVRIHIHIELHLGCAG